MAEAPTDSLINQEDGRKYWEGIDADVNGSKQLRGFQLPLGAIPENEDEGLVLELALSLAHDTTTDPGVVVLGGFPYISKIDLQGSRNFLAKLGIGTKEGLRTVTNCLEGGAG